MLKQSSRKYIQPHIVFFLLLLTNTLESHATERYHFNMPAMDAAAALNQLADISGYSLLYPFDDSIVVVTNPLVGSYSLSDALTALLLNTHLSATATEKRVIAVSSVLGNYKSSGHFAMNALIKNQLKQRMNTILDKSDIELFPFRALNTNYASDNEPKNANQEAGLERIQIIGSRRHNRSPGEALAPLDVINNQVLRLQGKTDIISILTNVVPSYNVTQEAISDAATIVRPANLRGLPTDSTLVLVNGKRRHRSGVIYEYVSGINIGAHGVDLEPIPSIALKSIEVLKDGAAAQYGSDAIAGVINFRLENNPEADLIEVRTGQFYAGDGRQLEVSGIWGSQIANMGTANFSFELSDSESTSRGIQDPAVHALIESGINPADIQNPVVHWGAPEITNNIKLFSNIELDIGEINNYKQVYLFGNWAYRNVDGSFFYRNPNTRSSVFINPNDGSRLFFDMTDNNSGNCPTATMPGGVGDVQALSAVSANPNCFAFNEWFSGGFTPRLTGKVTDNSLTAGLRGALDYHEAELTYDLSMVIGKNHVDYQLRNSVNASLGEHSPLEFELGSQIQTERVFNADFTYPIDIGFESELNVAFGYQHHFEQFEIIAGDKASYEAGPFVNNGEAIGANGFPGFSPETANTNNRRSNAVYLDIESDVTESLSMSLAMRYEDIGKIGNTFDGKISARLQLTNQLAFRSTLSSGFRAPTVGQSTLQRISTTNSIINGIVAQQTSQLVSALSPIAVDRSGGGLEPETSTNFGFGLLSEIGPLNITLDYFHIDIVDRLSLFTSDIRDTDTQLLIESDVNSNVSNIQYYANDFNSTTQGIDLIGSLPFEMMGGNNLLSLAFNYTNTELKVTNAKSPIANIDVRKEREKGIPNTRAVLTLYHGQGDINAMVRVNYYGSFFNAQFNDISLLEKVDPIVITDAEVSYNITDNVVVAVGAKNIFDVFPDEVSAGRTPGFLGAIYPINSPYGFNGGYYYFRMGWNF